MATHKILTDLDVGGKVITTEIESASTILLDAAADIVLDAGGADVTLKDDGTTFGALNNNGGELRIQSGSTPTTTSILYFVPLGIVEIAFKVCCFSVKLPLVLKVIG